MMDTPELETREHVEPKENESVVSLKSRMSRVWTVLGQDLPRSEVVYFSQMFIIYVVVITSIFNLSIGEEKSSLWLNLLTSACSYLLPPPQLNKDK